MMRVGLRGGLAALVLGLTLATPGSAVGSTASSLTPARVHLIAQKASVLRALLRVENSVTYEAAALRPSREAIAEDIRADNKVLIQACSAVILDAERITRDERRLHRAQREQRARLAAENPQATIEALRARIGNERRALDEQLGLLLAEGGATNADVLRDLQRLSTSNVGSVEATASIIKAVQDAVERILRKL